MKWWLSVAATSAILCAEGLIAHYGAGRQMTWPSALAGADTCTAVSVGVDTSLARDPSVPSGWEFVAAIDGEAPGETFLAVDTLLKSITVWRHPVETPNATPMKLWIVEVDSAGMPLTDHVVLEGPIITVTFGDGVHPIKIQYSFDPPVALPRRGEYFFAVQEQCSGAFDLLAARRDIDPYPGGEAWRTGRSALSGCILRPYPGRLISNDLAFTIEFCSEAVTSVRPTSWGGLKTIYR